MSNNSNIIDLTNDNDSTITMTEIADWHNYNHLQNLYRHYHQSYSIIQLYHLLYDDVRGIVFEYFESIHIFYERRNLWFSIRHTIAYRYRILNAYRSLELYFNITIPTYSLASDIINPAEVDLAFLYSLAYTMYSDN